MHPIAEQILFWEHHYYIENGFASDDTPLVRHSWQKIDLSHRLAKEFKISLDACREHLIDAILEVDFFPPAAQPSHSGGAEAGAEPHI